MAPDWSKLVGTTMEILQEESSLNEIVRLVGIDALGFKDRITMECARSIREDFLHQNSFHEVDTYTSLEKQYDMLKLIITWYEQALEAMTKHVNLDKIIEMPIREKIGRAKYIPESERKEKFAELNKELEQAFAELTEEGDDNA